MIERVVVDRALKRATAQIATVVQARAVQRVQRRIAGVAGVPAVPVVAER
jgi:hypothetical protein